MASAKRVRVAVVGSTGYAGAELVRLISRHPGLELTTVTSERDAGRPLGAVHASLGHLDLRLEPVDIESVAAKAEYAFVALPHGTSTPVVAGLLRRGVKIIDLGADFRFADVAIFEQHYGGHQAPELLEMAAYGLTEYARDRVAGADLVANPGCYPTAALLGLLPLAEFIAGPVVVDAKSGTSGAGRAAKTDQLFAEVTENIRPYGVGVHRHQPEMTVQLKYAAGRELSLLFSPHLMPVARGLLSTSYVSLAGDVDPRPLLVDRYADESFISVLDEGLWPEPRRVRGTNQVEIGCTRDPASGLSVVICAIDNLGKGAAGQALQNLNCMLGLDERSGLDLVAALP